MKRMIKHKIRQSIMAAISLSDSKRRSLTVTRQRDTRAVGSNDSKRARAAPRRPAGPATHAEWRKNGGAKNGRSALLGPRPLLAGYPPSGMHAPSSWPAQSGLGFSPLYLPSISPSTSPISPGLLPAQSGLWATRDSRCDSREGRDGRATT